jgi:hypothetical protein
MSTLWRQRNRQKADNLPREMLYAKIQTLAFDALLYVMPPLILASIGIWGAAKFRRSSVHAARFYGAAFVTMAVLGALALGLMAVWIVFWSLGCKNGCTW